MLYKAIIFDLDGTAVQTHRDALPTQNTIDIVKMAQSSIFVSIATGRVHYRAKDIVNSLGIKEPCIFAGGAQIKNPVTGKILWSKEMSQLQVEHILELCKKYPYDMYFSEDKRLYHDAEKIPQPEMAVYLQHIPKEKAGAIIQELKMIEGIAPVTTGSWKEGCWDIHITHQDATKKQACERLMSLFQVKREEVMVVGDTANDLPLFESGGLKVAMGNATDELKSKADFVTLDVNHDGLAYAIKTFIF